MNQAAVNHRPTLDYIYPLTRNKLCVKISLAKNDVKKVSLVWWFRFETDNTKLRKIEMKKVLSDGYSDYFECILDANQLAAYIRYYFVLESDREVKTYGSFGFTDNEPSFNDNFFEFLWPNNGDRDNAPSWSNSLIYYQIFPERFNNGSNILSPKNCEPWGSEPTRLNFMGGDLVGITNKLDYIRDLGVTCIYMTPIFKAPSNHKYDTIDYYDIDSSFGSKDDLKKLVEEAHKKELKILLDGVFNHCGYYNPMFQDVVEKGKDSKYANWFFIDNFPVSLDDKNYDCVGHYKWMPKMNLDNPEVVEYFIKVGEYWIKEFNIDGWRLDVSDEISASFWQKFSSRIKKLKPNALLLGETWGDAGKIVSANRLDTAMNYLFRDATVAWLAKKKINVSRFDHLINRMLSLYRKEVSYRLYNPLDSHDTARFLRECNEDVNYFKLAVALQMTIPGCPAIFYGDEVGLSGDNDPGCRVCMEWNEAKQNKDLLSWYKKLITIRKESSAIINGDYKTLVCDDTNNVYGFSRSDEKENMIVVINAGLNNFDISSLFDVKEYEEVLKQRYITDQKGNTCASVPACSVHIYKRKES